MKKRELIGFAVGAALFFGAVVVMGAGLPSGGGGGGGGGGISGLDQDSSPQLAGDLDVLTFDIVDSGSGTVTFDPDNDGTVELTIADTFANNGIRFIPGNAIDFDPDGDGDVQLRINSAASFSLNFYNEAEAIAGYLFHDTTNNDLELQAAGTDKLRLAAGGGLQFDGDNDGTNSIVVTDGTGIQMDSNDDGTEDVAIDGSGYLRFNATSAGAPTAGDCDADAERGRLVIDTTNHRLYVCNGGTRLWDYVALTD